MFKIGEFSRLTQVTVKALRHYDQLGLLTPAQTDPFTGYRSYAADQLPRLNRLLALKDLGLALDQIGPFLDADLSAEQLRALLLMKENETRQRLEAERARLARIEARLRQLDAHETPDYDIVVKHVAPLRVAAIRRTLPERAAVATLFPPLRAYQQRHGLAATDWLVIWNDQDFRATDVDAEAAFVTADDLPPDAAVHGRELPAATLACVVHVGPPETICNACMAVGAWLDANGYALAGPERVRAIARAEQPGQDTIAELQFPIARRAASGRSGED